MAITGQTAADSALYRATASASIIFVNHRPSSSIVFKIISIVEKQTTASKNSFRLHLILLTMPPTIRLRIALPNSAWQALQASEAPRLEASHQFRLVDEQHAGFYFKIPSEFGVIVELEVKRDVLDDVELWRQVMSDWDPVGRLLMTVKSPASVGYMVPSGTRPKELLEPCDMDRAIWVPVVQVDGPLEEIGTTHWFVWVTGGVQNHMRFLHAVYDCNNDPRVLVDSPYRPDRPPAYPAIAPSVAPPHLPVLSDVQQRLAASESALATTQQELEASRKETKRAEWRYVSEQLQVTMERRKIQNLEERTKRLEGQLEGRTVRLEHGQSASGAPDEQEKQLEAHLATAERLIQLARQGLQKKHVGPQATVEQDLSEAKERLEAQHSESTFRRG